MLTDCYIAANEGGHFSSLSIVLGNMHDGTVLHICILPNADGVDISCAPTPRIEGDTGSCDM